MACLLPLLAACGKSGDSAPSDGDAVPSAAVAVRADSNATQLPAYRKAVFGLVAGQYQGQCHGIDAIGAPETLNITPAGAASSEKWQADLAAGTGMLILGRKFGAGAPPAASFTDNGTVRPWNLVINSEQGGTALFGESLEGRQCLDVGLAAALPHKALYSAVAGFMRRAATDKLSCVVDGRLQARDFKPHADGVTIDTVHFSFDAALAKETIIVDGQAGSLQYGADYADGGQLIMIVDSAGKLQSVSGMAPRGKPVMCAPPAKE